ncbi:MAG: aspartate/glutamate racemase family protein [Nitrospirae bacterium]|nr:aspartate/glutamate racemase family protein [Nitrospirota bacterium]
MIGILGGMGAAAGLDLAGKLVKECQARGCKKDTDFPEFVLYNLLTSGITEAGVTDEAVLEKDLRKGVSFLQYCGADAIVIACNSAHRVYEKVKNVTGANIFSIVEAAIEVVGDRRYGLISTKTTRDFGLYENAITVSDNRQQQLELAIDHATTGSINKNDLQNVEDIITELCINGAEVVVVGCTELPLVVPPLENLIDAGECVIKKICDWRKI